MRANTQKIYDRLSKGGFIAVDSTDVEVRQLFTDIEENFDDYESYFRELGLRLDSGARLFHLSQK